MGCFYGVGWKVHAEGWNTGEQQSEDSYLLFYFTLMCSFNLLEGGTIEPLSSTDKHDYNGHFLISTGVLKYEKQLYVSILEIGSKSMTRNTEMLTTFDNWIFLLSDPLIENHIVRNWIEHGLCSQWQKYTVTKVPGLTKVPGDKSTWWLRGTSRWRQQGRCRGSRSSRSGWRAAGGEPALGRSAYFQFWLICQYLYLFALSELHYSSKEVIKTFTWCL